MTTPPFSEPLLWNVIPDVIYLSPKTLSFFHNGKDLKVGATKPNEIDPTRNDDATDDGIYTDFGGGNRNPQPINGRQIIKVKLHDPSTFQKSTVGYSNEPV